MSPAIAAAHRGRLFALGCATSFAAIPLLGRLAYDDGASPGVVILTRLLFGALAGGIVVVALRRRWTVPRRDWPAMAVVCVGWVGVTVGYMASYYYIPVSLAVLIFFLFPVLIAVVSPLVARQRPDPITLGAAIIAFVGLAMALGPDLGALDWRGCALAFMAAVGATSTLIISQKLLTEQDLFAFSMHIHWICSLVIVAGFVVFGVPTVPVSAGGWLALVGVAGFYVAAVLQQFAAIRLAGPARSALVMNVEPVLTMLGAALLLSELLGSWQMAGAGLVIAGVLLSTRSEHRP